MTWGTVLLALLAQQADQKAIDKGAITLKTKFQQPRGIAPTDYELVVWTLLHAGATERDPIGALAIVKTLLKESDVAKDPRLQRGFNWLAQNFSVKENPKAAPMEDRTGKKTTPFFYYFLYSLERAGDLTGTEKFGDHEWYPVGATELVKTQKPEGTWAESNNEGDVWATCFAVLFLKHATKPLPTIHTGK